MIFTTFLVLVAAHAIVADEAYPTMPAEVSMEPTTTKSPYPSQDELNDGTKICKDAGVVCPKDDYETAVYQGIDENTKFCQCSNGRPYLLICPPGTRFNGENNCGYPPQEEENSPEEY